MQIGDSTSLKVREKEREWKICVLQISTLNWHFFKIMQKLLHENHFGVL